MLFRSSDADIAALAAKYKGKPIDLLLNNAGILGNLQTSKIGQLTRKDFLEVMDVNVFGSLAVAQALRDNVAMSKQKKIVAVSSGIGSTTSADRIGPGPYYYRISKAALDMSMRALAQDVKAQGVIVALISPTPADTDMLATYRKTFGMGTMKSATPAEAVTKAIPVIDGIDQAKAAKGMLVADGNVLPW